MVDFTSYNSVDSATGLTLNAPQMTNPVISGISLGWALSPDKTLCFLQGYIAIDFTPNYQNTIIDVLITGVNIGSTFIQDRYGDFLIQVQLNSTIEQLNNGRITIPATNQIRLRFYGGSWTGSGTHRALYFIPCITLHD